jgi:hypothetical protein
MMALHLALKRLNCGVARDPWDRNHVANHLLHPEGACSPLRASAMVGFTFLRASSPKLA